VSYVLPTHGPEPEIGALVVAMTRLLPIRTFLDVGANFGYYAWLIDDHAGGAVDVHLFEPDSRNVALIERTIARRGDRATLHPIALSDAAGEARFFRDMESGHRGSLVFDPGRRVTISVPTMRFDDLDIHLEQLVLVKIDVEGAEELVLGGAASLLAARPVILLECYHRGEGSAVHLLAHGHDYTLLDVFTGGPPTDASHDFLALPPRFDPGVLDQLLAVRSEVLAQPALPHPERTRQMSAGGAPKRTSL
jgi:FkbM family methyltransferase